MRQIIIELVLIINGEYLLIHTGEEKIKLPSKILLTDKTGHETIKEIIEEIINTSLDELSDNNLILSNHTLHPFSTIIKRQQPLTLIYGLNIEGDTETYTLHNEHKMIHLNHVKQLTNTEILTKLNQYVMLVTRELS